jgi:hypothetical protein
MVAMTMDTLYKRGTYFLWKKQMQLAGTLYDRRGQGAEFVTGILAKEASQVSTFLCKK